METDSKPVEFSGSLTDLGNLKDVETKYPVIPAGLYKMKISGFKRDDKPNSKTGKPQSQLVIELMLTDFAKNKNNDAADVPPGHKLTDRILLTPTGDCTETMIKQKCARLMNAVLGHHDGAFDTGDLLGKEVLAQVGVRPEREDRGKTYPECNEISKYVPKG